MKKIIITLVFLFQFVFGVTSTTSGFEGVSNLNQSFNMEQQNQSNQEKQKTIETKKDYDQFVKDMEDGILNGDNKASPYYLGLLYLTDLDLKDGGRVEKNIPQAEKYLQIALDNQNYAASFNLAMIQIYKKDYDKGIFILGDTLSNLGTATKDNKNIKLFLAAAYASSVLQYKYENKEYIKKGIIYLNDVASKEQPTSLFLLANLYNADNNTKKADLLLSVACDKNNPALDARLKRTCNFYLTDQIIPASKKVEYIESNNTKQEIIKDASVTKNEKERMKTIFLYSILGFVFVFFLVSFLLRKRIFKNYKKKNIEVILDKQPKKKIIKKNKE